MTERGKSVMVPQRVAILKPRLFILVLPLFILCLVMSVRTGGENDSGLGEGGGRSSRDRELSGTGDGSVRQGLPLATGSAFEVKASPLDPGHSRMIEAKNWGKASTDQERASLVWEQLKEKIPDDFSGEETLALRSYLNELVAEDEVEKRWLCWSEDTSHEKALLYREVENLAGLNPGQVGLFANQFLGSGRWGNVASHSGSTSDQGRPVTLTWSIVPDGTMAPGLSGQAAEESDLQEFLDGIYGSNPGQPLEEQPWFPVLEAAFEAMGDTCGVNFVYEPNDDGAEISTFLDGILGTRGDIRLAARALDGASDTLAFAYSPGYGDFVIDSSDNFFNSTGASSIRLHNVITHELGHALGLAHVCPLNQTKLMEPLITLGYRGPRFDEFQSLQRQYGDPLEHHSSERDNDSLVDAAPLPLLIDDTLSYPRLSIDDNADLDYFRVSVLGGQKLTIDIEPSLGAYLEGEQVGDTCTGGELFDPGNIHDLTLELLNSTGGEVLASSFSGGLGEGESLTEFEIPEDGDYYLRVNGGSANATQIYSLDIYMQDRPPRPEFSFLDFEIVAESGKVKNGRPDPDETLKVAVELKNIGNLATSDLQVSLAGPPNLTLFEVNVPSTVVAPNETTEVELIFGLRGLCGIEIPLTLTVEDPGMESQDFPLSFVLGDLETEELMNEGFDASTALPDGWSASTTGSGASWLVLPSVNHTSAPNAMFCQGVGATGQSILTSPSVTLGGEGGTLLFRHQYDMESTWDGCVLEASRNGGAWFDLLESEAEVVSGDYNSSIRSSSTSGLASRRAWTGEVGSFLTTEINLPSSWAGNGVRFRWIIASDRSVGSEGWYVDDVQVMTSTAICEVHEPELTMNSNQVEVVEGETFQVEVSSVLPLVLAQEVTLSIGGEASAADLSGDLTGNIASGSDSTTFTFQALADGLTEGDESLVLSLDGEGISEALTLKEASGYASWAARYGLSGENPGLDGDGDGFSGLAEYLLDTDPTDRASAANIEIVLSDEDVLFPLGDLPVRPDVTIGAERSTDLMNWIPTTVTRTPEGLEVPRTGEKSYLRLTFSLNE